MRKILYVLALLAFATPLFASDPMTGTWKLDSAKTKYTTGTPAKDLTLVIVQDGDNLQVTATGTNADGTPIAIKYTLPVNGGPGSVQSGPFDAVVSKHVSATTRENTFTKDGKVVRTRRAVLSKDGKTLTVTVGGVDAGGNPVAGNDVFDKQM
jgi:hypothetical protein